MPTPDDLWTTTAEYAGDDAGYAWWRNAHPAGFVLAVRARHEPVLHKASCGAIDRDRHPGRLRAKGSRQICADTKPALRAWVAREPATEPAPAAGATAPSATLARCPLCGP